MTTTIQIEKTDRRTDYGAIWSVTYPDGSHEEAGGQWLSEGAEERAVKWWAELRWVRRQNDAAGVARQ